MIFKIGKNCQIHPSAVIRVNEGSIGEGTIINENARIEGQKVVIGRESFIDRGATIGGGSCFDPQAELRAGDWLHMGVNSHINTARGVFIGHEFGCGIETKIFTHGAYIDSYNLGAPAHWESVHIGDEVWCPNAWINPGVTIGSQVVIAVRSLVNSNLPNRCLAGGIPAKIIRHEYLPQKIDKQKVIDDIILQTQKRLKQNDISSEKINFTFYLDENSVKIKNGGAETLIDLSNKVISGDEKVVTLLFKDQLRRNGLRFRYEWVGEKWSPWTL